MKLMLMAAVCLNLMLTGFLARGHPVDKDMLNLDDYIDNCETSADCEAVTWSPQIRMNYVCCLKDGDRICVPAVFLLATVCLNLTLTGFLAHGHPVDKDTLNLDDNMDKRQTFFKSAWFQNVMDLLNRPVISDKSNGVITVPDVPCEESSDCEGATGSPQARMNNVCCLKGGDKICLPVFLCD